MKYRKTWWHNDRPVAEVQMSTAYPWLFGLRAGIDDESGLNLTVVLFRLGVFFALRRWPAYPLRERLLRGGAKHHQNQRDIGLHVCAGDGDGIVSWLFDATLTVDLWAGMDSQGLTPGWPWNHDGWHLYLHPLRWIVGDLTCEHAPDASEETVTVRMPEGPYRAAARVGRVRWNRRLWPGRWHWRGSIEVPSGIPLPGKGENSWDCDDDAVYGCTFAVEDERPDPHELANRLALDALRTRVRYGGGTDWTPRDGWPAPEVPSLHFPPPPATLTGDATGGGGE